MGLDRHFLGQFQRLFVLLGHDQRIGIREEKLRTRIDQKGKGLLKGSHRFLELSQLKIVPGQVAKRARCCLGLGIEGCFQQDPFGLVGLALGVKTVNQRTTIGTEGRRLFVGSANDFRCALGPINRIEELHRLPNNLVMGRIFLKTFLEDLLSRVQFALLLRKNSSHSTKARRIHQPKSLGVEVLTGRFDHLRRLLDPVQAKQRDPPKH